MCQKLKISEHDRKSFGFIDMAEQQCRVVTNVPWGWNENFKIKVYQFLFQKLFICSINTKYLWARSLAVMTSPLHSFQ